MKDLTPDGGPHSGGIATRGQSACCRDVRPIARPTDNVRARLEHLIALPDPVEDLATPLATSTEPVTTAGTRRTARPVEASAQPRPITRASRR